MSQEHENVSVVVNVSINLYAKYAKICICANDNESIVTSWTVTIFHVSKDVQPEVEKKTQKQSSFFSLWILLLSQLVTK